jgi:dolichol kinase
MIFILLDGGFCPNELAIVSLSGVVFLGIGDAFAAVVGNRYGRSCWTTKGTKTTEGSWACVISVSIVYYIICYLHENYLFRELFMVLIFATLIASIAEGMTFQFDNLICPIVYFISIMQLYEFFLSY